MVYVLSWDCIVALKFKTQNLKGLQFITVDRMSLVSPPSSKGRTIPWNCSPVLEVKDDFCCYLRSCWVAAIAQLAAFYIDKLVTENFCQLLLCSSSRRQTPYTENYSPLFSVYIIVVTSLLASAQTPTKDTKLRIESQFVKCTWKLKYLTEKGINHSYHGQW